MEMLVIELKLKHIAKQYLDVAKLQITRSGDYLSSYSIRLKLFFCERVETAYDSLPPSLKIIINNDFFYQDYPGWWKSSYSKKQYHKLKRKAVNLFLEVFYESGY